MSDPKNDIDFLKFKLKHYKGMINLRDEMIEKLEKKADRLKADNKKLRANVNELSASKQSLMRKHERELNKILLVKIEPFLNDEHN